jgi:hypothetical protein
MQPFLPWPKTDLTGFAQHPLKPGVGIHRRLGLVIAAHIKEALFHGISTPEEVERDIGMPLLGFDTAPFLYRSWPRSQHQ